MTTFCTYRKHCQKVRTKHKPRKNKIYDSGMEKQFKKNERGQLTIKNYIYERVKNFKYLGVILNEDNYQVDLQERIKNANKTYLMLQKFFINKNISKKLKLRIKTTIIDKTLT